MGFEDDWPRGEPIRLEGVGLRRGGADLLRGIDLTFEPGLSYVIAGPSGAGKSSLLRLLNRLDDPTSGRLLVGAIPMVQIPVRALRTGVGLVFQSPRALPGTVAENLSYPAAVRGRVAPEAGVLAGALVEVGLNPAWLDRDVGLLSGGERQRLALATALLAGPEVLALDEPTSALDPATAHRVAELLRQRSRRDGLRVVAVTHHREHAAWLGERVVMLDAGRVVDEGPTSEVLARAEATAWAGSGVAP